MKWKYAPDLRTLLVQICQKWTKDESGIPGMKRGRLATVSQVWLITKINWSNVRYGGPVFSWSYLVWVGRDL